MYYRKMAINQTRQQAILEQKPRKLTYLGPNNREEIFTFDTDGEIISYSLNNLGNLPVKLNREEKEIISTLENSYPPVDNFLN